jgi:HEAT repeat protein
MLLPDQVIPFLQHDNPVVRNHASNYLAKAHDPSPATAEDLWRSIDRFGVERSAALLADLVDFPQTDRSCTRALDVLRAGAGDDADYHLQQALSWVDWPLLLARRDELLADEKLLAHVRDHLRQRLELSERPLDELWDALVRHSQDVDGRHWGEFDSRVSERLVEAVVRRGEPASVRALDRLLNGPRDDYMEIFCVQVLGEACYAPATEALVERLLIPDADLLNEEAAAALGRVGTVDVVERLEAAYPSQEWGVRLFVAGPLGRIKRPDSERALLRLLGAEPEVDLRTQLASQLSDLCTTEGLDVIRRMVIEDDYDPQVADLEELVVTVATMTGFEFPEAREFRERADLRRREREKRIARMRDGDDIVREIRERWRRGEPPWPATDEPDDYDDPPGAGDDDWDEGPYLPPPAGATYRRAAPKVGRNDPCPCGSGKKYKKCCLRPEPA